MAEPRFRAAPPDQLERVPLDSFVAVFHRPSGITHLLTAPAPELLAALADGPLTHAELADRLADAYDVVAADPGSLAARIDELVAAGLVIAA